MSETTGFNIGDNNPTEESGAYWQEYGLNQSPFEDNSQFAMYYPRPEWQAYIEQLREFCNGDGAAVPIQIIQGELGSGKSMIIAQLLAQIDQTTLLCHMKGQDGINVPQLIKEIARAFDISLQQEQLFIDEQIHALAESLGQMRKGRYLVVVDDADLLPVETLNTIIQLALMQDQQRVNLHILLASELRLENQLQHLAQEMHNNLRIPVLELTPLNLDETKNYLRHRLMRAGLKEKMLFSKEMINYIYHLSGGIPGRINRVAQQMLIDNLRPDNERTAPLSAEKNPAQPAPGVYRKQYSVKILSGILLVAVGIAIWQFNHRPDNSPNRVHAVAALTLPDKQPAAVAAENTASAPAAMSPTVVVQQPIAVSSAATPSPMPTANAQPLTLPQEPVPPPPGNVQALNSTALRQPQPTVAEPATAVTANAIASAVTGSAPASTDAPMPRPTPLPMQAQNQVGIQEVTDKNSAVSADVSPKLNNAANANAAVANTTTKVTVGSHRSYTSAEKQLLAMQGYTLQVLGSRSPRDLQTVISHDKSAQNRFLQFRTKFLGKPWHVLVYGNYPSRDRAQAAAERLTQKMPGVHPWVRPLASVHDAIKSGG